MSCLITNGILRGCRDNSGGLVTAYVASWDVTAKFINTGTTYSAWTGVDAGVIIDIQSGNTGGKFYEFKPNKLSSEYKQNGKISYQNGTVAYEQAVTLMFAKNEANKRNLLQLLAQNALFVIVLDYNGKYWLIGEYNGAELTAAETSTGKALEDMNGATITITGFEHYPAKEIDPTVMTTAIALAEAGTPTFIAPNVEYTGI